MYKLCNSCIGLKDHVTYNRQVNLSFKYSNNYLGQMSLKYLSMICFIICKILIIDVIVIHYSFSNLSRKCCFAIDVSNKNVPVG